MNVFKLLGISPFKPLEEALLEHLCLSVQDTELRAKLTKQIQAVNKVQRHGENREINLYGSASECGIEHPSPEHQLASVVFDAGGKRFKAKMWLVSGRLFQIQVSPSPTDVLGDARPNILSIDVYPPRPIETAEMQPISGPLAELADRYRISDLRPPLGPDERAALLDRLDAPLPPDFLDLTQQADGFSVGDIEVSGLRSVRTVPSGAQTLIVLAELPEGRFVVAGAGAVQLIDHEGTVLSSHSSFLATIYHALREATSL